MFQPAKSDEIFLRVGTPTLDSSKISFLRNFHNVNKTINHCNILIWVNLKSLMCPSQLVFIEC